MKARRQNPRVVALVIYALFVNLAWFATVSAHHAGSIDAWCSASRDGAAARQTLTEHDSCHDFCGAHAGPSVLGEGSATRPLAGPMAVDLIFDAVTLASPAMPWLARGPPSG